MASNPPFQLEDQTDEDFFDKLVDDDFVGLTESATKFADCDDSDDGRSFATLSINDVANVNVNAFEDLGVVTGFEGKGQSRPVDFVPVVLGASREAGNSLVSFSSVGCDSAAKYVDNGMTSEFTSNSTAQESNVTDFNVDGIVSELKVDSTVGKSNNSGGSKEVGWSSFYADSAQNGGHGLGSDSDFFNALGEDSGTFCGNVGNNLVGGASVVSANEDITNKSVDYLQYKVDQIGGVSMEQSTTAQDMSSNQYWENLYPGWRYDSVSGQWYQVEGFDAASNVQESVDTSGGWAHVSDGNLEVSRMQDASASDEKMEVSHMQQTHSVVGTVTESSTPGVASNWNQASQVNSVYPEHMFFDPQYPGWYYDTIAQEWLLLESYNQSIQSSTQVHGQQNQNGYILTSSDNSLYGDYMKAKDFNSQIDFNHGQDNTWVGSHDNNIQHGFTNWQSESRLSEPVAAFDGNHQSINGSNMSVGMDHQKTFSSFAAGPSHHQPSQGHGEMNGAFGLPSVVPTENFIHQYDPRNVMQKKETSFSNDSHATQKPIANFQQSFQGLHNSSYASNFGRSSAGRPPHALVTFGFGGKLVVIKDNSSFGNLATGTQNPVGGLISVLNLMEVVTANSDASSFGLGSCSYFSALCQRPLPGPLVGGSVGNKELNKWVDERMAKCESSGTNYKKGEAVRLLLNLLKIACQHYGKLRSPFGTDPASRDNDSPESAVAKLFASAKSNGAQFNEYANLHNSLQQLPSEGQIKATASEVQNLLVSGRKKDALQCAQEGQLWGPALVLASQLGDRFYVDTVKQMALRELVAGTPLRTLCLLIAGQPAEVFSMDSSTCRLPTSVNMSQNPLQYASNSMLDDWEENLAVITANKTKDDELVIIHLGDCLWKERSEITAAHICYLVAEAKFEAYSDSARLCLIGSDHWKSPRTYASPEAIQRTELYEYSKVLGNSQFVLLPFQPYKLIYAHMLAEVGKVSDSLKYCQAVSKALKTGRSPEVEMWKQLVASLEERIRMHQQSGYTANLAPAKLVGKLLNFFDSTAHRVVGGLPPTAPSSSHRSIRGSENYHQPLRPRVSTSMSTMDMSSLMPSASMEPINEWTTDGTRMIMPNRSVSEPDFGRTSRQDHSDSSKETSTEGQGKASDTGRESRLSRFGFGTQLLQKTVGLVMRPRQDKQVKLGDKNKFYYDEKLKRWVEEGVEPPPEEVALPPPPTTAAFQNGISDYNMKSVLKEALPARESSDIRSPTPTENTPGTPSIAPSSNQFSAHGRMSVRSRYVDTFNQGGGRTTNLFPSPSVPSAKPATAANTKFFIPSPVLSGEQAMEAIAESSLKEVSSSVHPHLISSNTVNDSFQSPPPPSPSPSPSIQRFPSMGNIPSQGVKTSNDNSLAYQSRRVASWSGSFNDAHTPKMVEAKPLGQALGGSPSSYMHTQPPLMHMQMNGCSPGFGDELHEVEL